MSGMMRGIGLACQIPSISSTHVPEEELHPSIAQCITKLLSLEGIKLAKISWGMIAHFQINHYADLA